MWGSILSFAGPLVGEAIGLIGSYVSASKEERAALIVRKDAAMAEMRGERDKARAEVAARDDETRRIIREEMAKQGGGAP
jgi:hypothetical protein